MSRRNRHPPRKSGPLQKLRQTQDLPPDVGHIELDGPGASADLSIVFCPVREWAGSSPYCDYVDCGRCDHLQDFLFEEEPEYLWLCTHCSSKLRVLPYWTDGDCEGCGLYSAILAVASPS